jgi:predicted Zn-dependent protease
MHILHKAALYLTSISLVACTASPTGRKQVLLFSDQEMSSLGAQSFEEMKKNIAIEKDEKINAYVQCVANAVTDSVPKNGFSQWEVVVFKSDDINAFALPGGKIGVYTGLLNVAKNQDQLATVIGHEVAHVLAEHGNERMSQAQLTNAGLQLTNIAIGASEYSQYQQITMSALGLGVQYGVTLPYGRHQESEADIVGLELMANAGFDPKQSINLWQNMSAASNGAQVPELLSTHPSHQTRIADLTAKTATLTPYSGHKPNCS